MNYELNKYHPIQWKMDYDQTKSFMTLNSELYGSLPPELDDKINLLKKVFVEEPNKFDHNNAVIYFWKRNRWTFLINSSSRGFQIEIQKGLSPKTINQTWCEIKEFFEEKVLHV